MVRAAAAAALGRLHAERAIVPLLTGLSTASDDLFLPFAGALTVLGAPAGLCGILHEALRRERLVPFIGPDFPAALTGLPDRAELATMLGGPAGGDARPSLAGAAAATVMAGSRHRFTERLMRELVGAGRRPGRIHRALSRLPARLWISAAYDDLLPQALGADTITLGGDTQFWRPQERTLIRLAGDFRHVQSLLVLDEDYRQLRRPEEDRTRLVAFLLHALARRVVLFLGFDPASPDFALLVRHVLNGHLAAADVQAVLVWPEVGPTATWADRPIALLQEDPRLTIDSLEAIRFGSVRSQSTQPV
jgi:hypothetical protein